MHKRSYRASNARAGKSTKVSKRSFSDDARRHLADQASAQADPGSAMPSPSSLGEGSPKLNEEIVSLVVGRDERLFAAHERILSRSPWFAFKLTKGHEAQDQFSPSQKTISLPDDDPQVISAVLEFMYRGDYTPHLVHDRRTSRLSLDDSVVMAGNGPTMAQGSTETITPLNNNNRVARPADFATIFHSGVGDLILRDTAVYCAAHRFYMPDLERLALRKQGLQVGVDVATILRSAKFAYANTSGGESKLRAHYLTLIIRNRRSFMRSGTMQREMEKGGTMLFFDLFVAMCNHIDDVVARNGGGEGGCGPGHSRGSVVASSAVASTSTVNVGGCVHMASTSTLEVGGSPGRLINAARNKRPDYTGGSRF